MKKELLFRSTWATVGGERGWGNTLQGLKGKKKGKDPKNRGERSPYSIHRGFWDLQTSVV